MRKGFHEKVTAEKMLNLNISAQTLSPENNAQANFQFSILNIFKLTVIIYTRQPFQFQEVYKSYIIMNYLFNFNSKAD